MPDEVLEGGANAAGGHAQQRPGSGGAGTANKGQDGPAGQVFGPTPNCQP